MFQAPAVIFGIDTLKQIGQQAAERGVVRRSVFGHCRVKMLAF